MRGQPRDCRPRGTASAGEGYLLCAAAEGPWLALCPGWRAQSWDCTSAAPHGLSGQSHPPGLRAPHR